MISLFDTAKRILKSFFDDNLFSINNILSKTAIEALVRAIDKGIKKDYDKVLKSVNKEVRSKLKNEYNQFIKNDFEYKNIDIENEEMIRDIFEFEKSWEINEMENNNNNGEEIKTECEAFDKNKLLTHEVRAEADIMMINSLINNWKEIDGITGGVIYIDKKIAAYTIADFTMRDTIVVHSERGDRNYKGSYQAINRLFLENNKREGYKFVNREQDVGDLGLRKAKLSYNPVKFVEKYSGFCTGK